MGRFGLSLLTFACLFFCIYLNIEARNDAVNENIRRRLPPWGSPPPLHNLTKIGLSGEEISPKAAGAAKIYPARDSSAAGTCQADTIPQPPTPPRNPPSPPGNLRRPPPPPPLLPYKKRPPPPRSLTKIGLSGEEPSPKAAGTIEAHPGPDSGAAGTVKIEPARKPMVPGTEQEGTDAELMSINTNQAG